MEKWETFKKWMAIITFYLIIALRLLMEIEDMPRLLEVVICHIIFWSIKFTFDKIWSNK